jgi:hypothetical protein
MDNTNELEKIDMTEDEFERRQSWTHCAGKNAAYESVISYLMLQAVNMFRVGNDSEAILFRKTANEVHEIFQKPESQQLDRFIKGEI